MDKILTVRQIEWNQSGHFSNLGYTPASTGAAYADGAVPSFKLVSKRKLSRISGDMAWASSMMRATGRLV